MQKKELQNGEWNVQTFNFGVLFIRVKYFHREMCYVLFPLKMCEHVEKKNQPSNLYGRMFFSGGWWRKKVSQKKRSGANFGHGRPAINKILDKSGIDVRTRPKPLLAALISDQKRMDGSYFIPGYFKGDRRTKIDFFYAIHIGKTRHCKRYFKCRGSYYHWQELSLVTRYITFSHGY